MSKELTQCGISEKYNNALDPILYKYDDMDVIRITKDYHLLPNSDIKEEVDLTFYYYGDEPLNCFDWHIPYVNENTKVAGVRVDTNSDVTGLSTYKKDDFHLIRISLDSIKKYQHVHLRFEYYVIGSSNIKKGILWKNIHYPFAFVPAETVVSLDIRMHTPGKRKPKHDINIGKFIPIEYSDKYILLTSKEERVRDVHGVVSVQFKSKLYEPFLSVTIASILSTVFFLLPDTKPIIGESWYYVFVASLCSISILLTYWLFKE